MYSSYYSGLLNIPPLPPRTVYIDNGLMRWVFNKIFLKSKRWVSLRATSLPVSFLVHSGGDDHNTLYLLLITSAEHGQWPEMSLVRRAVF